MLSPILEMSHPGARGLSIFVQCLLARKQQCSVGNPESLVLELELFATMLCSEIPPWWFVLENHPVRSGKMMTKTEKGWFQVERESCTMQGTALAGDTGCSCIFKAEHTAQTQGSFLLPLFYEWNIKQGINCGRRAGRRQICKGRGNEVRIQDTWYEWIVYM